MQPDSDLSDFTCSIVAQACQLHRSSITPDTKLVDLNLDSLTLVSILAQIEAVYGLELTSEQILWMIESSAIADLVVGIEKLLSSQPSLGS